MNPRIVTNFFAAINLNCLAVAMKTMCEESNQADRPNTPRNGGVLAIAVVDPDCEGVDFMSMNVGSPGNKFGRYAKNAAEKVGRIFERRLESNDDIAASVSADDLLGTYGGCIVFSGGQFEVYISFSGAPPQIDEALAFVIGEKLGFTMLGEYKNEYISRARELLADLI